MSSKYFTISGALFFLLTFSSCTREPFSYYYDEPTIYSESNKTLLSEVVLFLKPYFIHQGKKVYIVSDNIENLTIKINNKAWKPTNSFTVDTVYLKHKETIDNYRISSEAICYPVSINVVDYPKSLETAGQYADILTDYIYLKPGTYIYQIVSFDIKNASGNLKTIYTPTLFLPLEVKENYVSINLGEFEIEIK